ncbi:uncharacterized protein LOC127159492 isoform X2 [Labeo rohita]|uniref:uncharacterized protein LOC127159492 isoform X2 n=1 Tax=Labeo rohita TaxID=84645 RepID=UPI0021E22DE6|nr:uncharacterized protein LOC127159492 isoform X2 [Labeo rohita]
MDGDLIQWRFFNTLIAEIKKLGETITVFYDVLDGRFGNRLKLDNQTGSLTITNTIAALSGQYELQINSVRKRFSLTVHSGLSFRGANLVVSAMVGESVTLNANFINMADDDLFQWTFLNENTLIAEINKEANSMTVYDDVLDGRFRDRLKLDNQTGSLTITNTTTEHAGRYKLQIYYIRIDYILTVYARLPVPVISSNSSQCSSSSSSQQNCSLVEYQDKNTYSCVVNNPISNQTQHLDISKLCHTCSDSVHCCGSTEAVIRLVLSALVGVATVILLVYVIRSRRAEQDQAHIHTSEA